MKVQHEASPELLATLQGMVGKVCHTVEVLKDATLKLATTLTKGKVTIEWEANGDKS